MKQLEKSMKEERRQQVLNKKERQLENAKRRAENEFKNIKQSMQTLNQHKVGYTIKAMSKKQLRQIKKSRVNTKTGVVEFVSPWAK
jgi:rRNA-processing protein CGR1